MKKRLLDVFVLFCMLSQWQLMNHPVDGSCLDTSEVANRARRFCVHDRCSDTYRSFNYKPENLGDDDITFNGDTCGMTSLEQRPRPRTSYCWPSAEVKIAAFESAELEWQDDHMTCHHVKPVYGPCFYHCQKDRTEPAPNPADLCTSHEVLEVVEGSRGSYYTLTDGGDETRTEIVSCLAGGVDVAGEECSFVIIDDDLDDCTRPIYKRVSSVGRDPSVRSVTCESAAFRGSPMIYKAHPTSHDHPKCQPMQFTDLCNSRPDESTPRTRCKSDPEITLKFEVTNQFNDSPYMHITLSPMMDDGIHLAEKLAGCFDVTQPLEEDALVKCSSLVVFYGEGDCLASAYYLMRLNRGPLTELGPPILPAAYKNFGFRWSGSWETDDRPLVCYQSDTSTPLICIKIPNSQPSVSCQPDAEDDALIIFRIGVVGAVYEPMDKQAEIQLEVTCSIHAETGARCGMIRFTGDGSCAAVAYKHHSDIGPNEHIPGVTEINGELEEGNVAVHQQDGDWKDTMIDCSNPQSGDLQTCTRYHLPGTDTATG